MNGRIVAEVERCILDVNSTMERAGIQAHATYTRHPNDTFTVVVNGEIVADQSTWTTAISGAYEAALRIVADHNTVRRTVKKLLTDEQVTGIVNRHAWHDDQAKIMLRRAVRDALEQIQIDNGVREVSRKDVPVMGDVQMSFTSMHSHPEYFEHIVEYLQVAQPDGIRAVLVAFIEYGQKYGAEQIIEMIRAHGWGKSKTDMADRMHAKLYHAEK